MHNVVLAPRRPGFYAIYQNKDNNGKPHFLSWHGTMGGLATAGVVVQALATVPALRPAWARAVWGDQKRVALVMRAHRLG